MIIEIDNDIRLELTEQSHARQLYDAVHGNREHYKNIFESCDALQQSTCNILKTLLLHLFDAARTERRNHSIIEIQKPVTKITGFHFIKGFLKCLHD